MAKADSVAVEDMITWGKRSASARDLAEFQLLTDGDVLLDVEVSGVQDSPEAGAAFWEELVPQLAKNECDNLEEKLTDIDGLRAEVEDLERGKRGQSPFEISAKSGRRGSPVQGQQRSK